MSSLLTGKTKNQASEKSFLLCLTSVVFLPIPAITSAPEYLINDFIYETLDWSELETNCTQTMSCFPRKHSGFCSVMFDFRTDNKQNRTSKLVRICSVSSLDEHTGKKVSCSILFEILPDTIKNNRLSSSLFDCNFSRLD